MLKYKIKKIKIFFGIAVFIAISSLFGFFYFLNIKNSNKQNLSLNKNQQNNSFISVRTQGAVKYDINFPFKKGVTIREILFKASVLPSADLSNINLETKIWENKNIYVPFVKKTENIQKDMSSKKNNKFNSKKISNENKFLIINDKSSINNTNNKNTYEEKEKLKQKKIIQKTKNTHNQNKEKKIKNKKTKNDFAKDELSLNDIDEDFLTKAKVNKNISEKILNFLKENKDKKITWKDIEAIYGVGPKTIEKMQNIFIHE
ncbi:hypothetical protein [Mesomycoplasma neurolyticum]|uniref:ComE operon protein 1 n=1 Tax=Mesomycoplasma neurolyticum TaxID=2120 RepID=A0A449A585_9BACT|nr:hypothetical protein [Mesomycoplasma neurolyticum]VEU59396.1 Uncharacterised protein [Mesomycoplasma neurolyticum]